MYCYWNCWYHMVYFFLCYHRHFTWCYPWRSSRLLFSYISMVTSIGVNLVVLPGFICYGVSTGTSRGATFGGLPGIIFLWFHPWSWYLVLLLPCGVSIHYLCLLLVLFYNHFTPPYIIPFGWFFSDLLGMILNNSARLINYVWCMSLIFTKGAFGVGFFNAST